VCEHTWLDATYVKASRVHNIVPFAIIIAVGVNTDGRREVLGMTANHSEPRRSGSRAGAI
jgi:putative transposase